MNGVEWLRVELPTLPNRRDGWIRADHVLVETTAWSVEVELSERSVTVLRAGLPVRRMRAVVGSRATPTPAGLFAVYDPVEQPDAGGPLGPWALHLTAVSEAVRGLDSRIAIHGRGSTATLDPLGSARSAGCIRVGDDEVAWLAAHLPRGTPVRILP